MSRRESGAKRFAGGKPLKSAGFTPDDLSPMWGPRTMRRIGWGGRQQIIYKHAISTIAPMRTVDLTEE